MRVMNILSACFVAFVPSQVLAQPNDPAECRHLDVFSPVQVANAFWSELSVSDSRETQQAIVFKYYSQISSDPADGLSQLDRLSLGEGAFLTFQGRKAHRFYEPLRSGKGLVAEHAWDRVMQIAFRGFGEYERAGKLLIEFRRKFPKSAKNVRGAYQAVGNFMSKHIENGEPEKAMSFLIDELDSLPADAPYLSYGLVLRFSEIIDKSARRNEIIEIVNRKNADLRQLQATWEVQVYPAKDDPILSQEMPSWYWKLQGVKSGETLRAARSRQLGGLIASLESWLGKYQR